MKRQRRHARVRVRVSGTAKMPRLSVYRSNKHMYAQLIDDEAGNTLATSSDMRVKDAEKKSRKEKARLVGEDIAGQAHALKIKQAVFDRGGFPYAGSIKLLADAARAKKLEF